MSTIYTLTGVTRDSRGRPLGNVVVEVYDTGNESFLGDTTADSDGNYTVTLSSSTSACFAVGYLAGSPDVAGTTLNNLVPVATVVPDPGSTSTWYLLGF